MDFGPWGNVAVLVTVAVATTYFTATQGSHLPWLRIKTAFGDNSKLDTSRPARKRALTLPLPEPRPASFWSRNHDLVQTTNVQEQCLFLTKLPLEIRMMVYRKVLGDRHFHLTTGETQTIINSFECIRDHKFITDSVHGVCYYTFRPKALIQLPMTCRQIYSECIDLLYTTNSFEFTQSFCFQSFVYALPQHRFKALRELKFYVTIPKHPRHDSQTWSDWEDLWQFFIEDLGNLRQLSVKLGMRKQVAKRIRTEAVDAAGWLMPAVKAAAATMAREKHDPSNLAEIKRSVKLVIPSGTDGQYLATERDKEPTELQSTVIDLADACRFVRQREDENAIVQGKRPGMLPEAVYQRLTCEYLQARTKQSLFEYRPYGKLFGDEDDD